MNQRVVPLSNGDFEVLNDDGTVQGMPWKRYVLRDGKLVLLSPKPKRLESI